jgi:hypothetical protein
MFILHRGNKRQIELSKHQLGFIYLFGWYLTTDPISDVLYKIYIIPDWIYSKYKIWYWKRWKKKGHKVPRCLLEMGDWHKQHRLWYDFWNFKLKILHYIDKLESKRYEK